MLNNTTPFKSGDAALFGIRHAKTFTFGNIQISLIKVGKHCGNNLVFRAEFLLSKSLLFNSLKSLLLEANNEEQVETMNFSTIEVTEKGIHLLQKDVWIQLCPLALAVYTTFLLHSKTGGLRLKDLKNDDIKAKLCQIYGRLRPVTELRDITICIEKLVNTDENNIHETISRINKKLKEELSEEESEYYGIFGNKGEAKSIFAAQYVAVEVSPTLL